MSWTAAEDSPRRAEACADALTESSYLEALELYGEGRFEADAVLHDTEYRKTSNAPADR